MGFNSNSGTVNVTGSVNALPAINAPITATIPTFTTAGTTIYTVTAGKTFYLMGFVAGCNYGGAGNKILILGAAGATIIQTGGLPSGAQSVTALAGQQPIASFAASVAIKMANSTAGDGGAGATIWGYEV